LQLSTFATLSPQERTLPDSILSEQIRARLREPDKRPALVDLQPAALDRQIKTGFVFGRRSLVADRNGPLIFSI
jgi:hypothetical protein